MKFLRRLFHADSLRCVSEFKSTNQEPRNFPSFVAFWFPDFLLSYFFSHASKPLMSRVFPCHPQIPVADSSSHWLRCPKCGTCVRQEQRSASVYDDNYPADRGHHDPAVGHCKVRSLERWLAQLKIDVQGRVVCEIGFGGGACLAALQNAGATVFGVEPVPANRAHAQQIGIPSAHLFDADPRPALPRKPDLWLLQDSFEHVTDPNELVGWMARESAPVAHVILVAPDAESISRKLMGPIWLFESPDHLIHYSKRGVAAIFGRAGFRLTRSFSPVKLISLGMAWNYLRLLARAPASAGGKRLNRIRIWFNIGEMGVLMERNDS
jgi:hypothetical protein